jgi:hypothetical protein
MYLHRTVRFFAGAIFAALIVAGSGLGSANAQTQTPTQLLQQNPNGGQLLINALEQLVLTTPSTFDAILGAVGGANDQQKIAIATALSQAAKTMVLTNEALAGDWQQKILAITDPTFKTAAVNAFGDVKLGAVGGGPLGGPLGGLAGGPGGVGGGAPQDIRSNPTSTPNFTFGSGTSGLGFVGGAAATNCTTCSNSPSSSNTIIITTTGNGQGNCGIGNGGTDGTPGNSGCQDVTR